MRLIKNFFNCNKILKNCFSAKKQKADDTSVVISGIVQGVQIQITACKNEYITKDE